MKKVALLILLFIGYMNYGQIRFERGYIVSDQNKKTSCLIKNVDWLNNPKNFEYKLTETGEVLKGDVTNISSFGVADLEFKRFTTVIDRSGVLVNQLSDVRAPEFEKATIFLRKMVAGEAVLYSFLDGNLSLFFMEVPGRKIEPLIYKRYLTGKNNVGVNNNYQQQLLNVLNCDKSVLASIPRMKYKKKEIIALFQRHNSCLGKDSAPVVPVKDIKKVKKGFFNLSIRPGTSLNTLKIPRRFPALSPFEYEFDSGQIVGYSIGAELEYVLPFNKNKWSVFTEPSFNTFKSDTAAFNSIGLASNINYKTFELPIGLRHYFFLTPNSKIFINGSYVLYFDLGSTFNPATRGFEFSKGTSQTLGIGYDFKNKFKIEGRYDTARSNVFPFSNNFVATIQSYSLVLGFNFL